MLTGYTKGQKTEKYRIFHRFICKMKILKYSIITILVLFLVFISIGILNPTFTYESRIEVNASPQKCWQIFTSQEKMKDWMLDLEEVKLLSGEEGQPGSEYEFTFRQNDEVIIVREKVAEIRKGEFYAFDLKAEILEARTEVAFENNGETTVIHSKTVAEANDMITRSLFSLMENTFKEQSDIQYERLKKLIEKEAGEE